jgi:prophage maintenance system killer protein
VDGNKRTGYAAMMMFLSRNGYTILASIDERERIFVSLAAGELEREEFLAWVRDRIVRKGATKPPTRPGPSGRRPDPPPAGSG